MLRRNNSLISIAGGLCGVLVAAACHNNPPPAAPPVTPAVDRGTTTVQDPPQQTLVKQTAVFNGSSAFDLLSKQCDFGPRPIGSEAHEKCLAFLLAEMRKYADQTISQKFDYPAAGKKLLNTNVIGIFYPAGSHKPSEHPILLMAHWDTRPIADGPYSAETRRGVTFRFNDGVWRPTAPIPGASDAASGVAVLLELARMFKANPPSAGVVMLLDDGEDYGDFQGSSGAGDGVELGARYFAEHYKDPENVPLYGQPHFGILLDMVGGKNAFFPREEISDDYAKEFNDRVYTKAKHLGYEKLFPEDAKQNVGDDHVSINAHGIPTLDLIDPLPYGEYLKSGYTYWHTLEDTPDKCSAKTLKAVGDVVAGVVYDEMP